MAISTEFKERYPKGDIIDAKNYFGGRTKYKDTYLIFDYRESGSLEHVGTLMHYRTTSSRLTDAVTSFIMRGKYGTFGCTRRRECT